MLTGAVYDPTGKVVLRYRDPMPKTIRIGNKDYFFDSKFGVSLGFVDEADVPPLLAYTKTCCGGNKTHPITLASEVAYSHWKDGLGGRA
jgi:hypothetical protein